MLILCRTQWFEPLEYVDNIIRQPAEKRTGDAGESTAKQCGKTADIRSSFLQRLADGLLQCT